MDLKSRQEVMETATMKKTEAPKAKNTEVPKTKTIETPKPNKIEPKKDEIMNTAVEKHQEVEGDDVAEKRFLLKREQRKTNNMIMREKINRALSVRKQTEHLNMLVAKWKKIEEENNRIREVVEGLQRMDICEPDDKIIRSLVKFFINVIGYDNIFYALSVTVIFDALKETGEVVRVRNVTIKTVGTIRRRKYIKFLNP